MVNVREWALLLEACTDAKRIGLRWDKWLNNASDQVIMLKSCTIEVKILFRDIGSWMNILRSFWGCSLDMTVVTMNLNRLLITSRDWVVRFEVGWVYSQYILSQTLLRWQSERKNKITRHRINQLPKITTIRVQTRLEIHIITLDKPRWLLMKRKTIEETHLGKHRKAGLIQPLSETSWRYISSLHIMGSQI